MRQEIDILQNEIHFDATRTAQLTFQVLPNNKFVESGETLSYEVMLTHPQWMAVVPEAEEDERSVSDHPPTTKRFFCPSAANTEVTIRFMLRDVVVNDDAAARQEKAPTGDEGKTEDGMKSNRPVRAMIVVACGRTTQRVRLNTNAKEVLGLC